MKATHWFTFALAVALPSTLMAQGAQEDMPPMDRPIEGETTERETTERESTTRYQSPDQDKDRAKKHKITSHVVPAAAGIGAADQAVAALYQLSGGEQLSPKDAQTTVKLARQGIDMALERAEALNKLTGLSDEAKAESDKASIKLREARTTLNQIDKQVGKKQANISGDKATKIREHARDLRTDLSDAEKAVGQVARAYDVPMEDLGG